MAGKPAHVPTDEIRKYVESMVMSGIPQERIAKVINIDVKTLYKYYRFELDCGKDVAVQKVAQTLFDKALSGDVSSMIFYLKTQGRWREPKDEDDAGKQPNVTFNLHGDWNKDDS